MLGKGIERPLFNYRNYPDEWNEKFDEIIANGSLKYFCQQEDATNGRQNRVYRKMFEIFSKLLNNDSPQKVFTIAIHFRGRPICHKKFRRSPFLQIFNIGEFHASVLHHGYRRHYPTTRQLEKCADNTFELVKEVDETKDYRIISEY